MGKTARLLAWDNASWHRSKEVLAWIRDRDRQVETSDQGARLLSSLELAERVCGALGCTCHEHIPIPEKVSRCCTSAPMGPYSMRFQLSNL